MPRRNSFVAPRPEMGGLHRRHDPGDRICDGGHRRCVSEREQFVIKCFGNKTTCSGFYIQVPTTGFAEENVMIERTDTLDPVGNKVAGHIKDAVHTATGDAKLAARAMRSS